MRLKQRVSLLLTGAMVLGTVGVINPTQVYATAPTNEYTLTVPAETTLAYDGSAVELTNGLKVSGGDLEDGKKVTVTATSAGDWQLSATGATTKISYGLYATTDATETTTSWDFSKTDAAGTGTTKTIYSKIVASEYQSAEAGDYSDTITFTAALASAATEVTYERTDGGGSLLSENLGTPTSWTYDGTTYQVYNAFIPSSSSSSWNDAMGFVAALNTAKFDGHSDWTLLSSERMATAWYNQFGTGVSAVERGYVDYLWSTVEDAESSAYFLYCDAGDWFMNNKSNARSRYGFVVLRGSSSDAATEVTYERTDGEGSLSSENLGTPTSWTYSGTTYQVYNAFIPSSSGSSWNDAMGFVAKLNEGTGYDGHKDWTLLSSKEMAEAWYNQFVSAVECGGVDFLWSFVEDDEDGAYCLRCNDGRWGMLSSKSNAYSSVGFVVLRGSSSDAATEVTYERTDGAGSLSSENLGTPTSWTYSGTTYQVYNAFIPSSSGSSWNDAMGFVAKLNEGTGYEGHKDWTLLSSEAMAEAWYNQFVSAVDRGDVAWLWSSVEDDKDRAYFLYCDYVAWLMDLKSYAKSYCGFIVLRGSSN